MKLREVLTEIAKPTYRVRNKERLVQVLHEFLLAQAREWGAKANYPRDDWTEEDKLADSYERLTHLPLRQVLPEIKEKSDEVVRKAGWNRD